MVQNLVIYGAGGMAAETAFLVKEINDVKPTFNLVSHVVDDEWFEENQQLYGIPVRRRSWLIENKDFVVCSCALGYPQQRKKIQESLIEEKVRFTNLIHPSVKIYQDVSIGNGCIFGLQSLVSSGCRIGDGVVLGGVVHIGHDSTLGNYVTCFTKSQISGKVTIDTGTLIGAMAFVNERKKIGHNAVVAPGSVVFNNVKSNTHVMGNPARKVEL